MKTEESHPSEQPAKTPPLVLAGRAVAVLVFAFLVMVTLIASLNPDQREWAQEQFDNIWLALFSSSGAPATTTITPTTPPIKDYTDAVAGLDAANDAATAAYSKWHAGCASALEDGTLSPTEGAAASRNLDNLKGRLSTFRQRLDEYAAILPLYLERLGENAATAAERIPELESYIGNMYRASQDCVATAGPGGERPTAEPATTATTTPSPTATPVETAALRVNVVGSGNGYMWYRSYREDFENNGITCNGNCNDTGYDSDDYKSLECFGSCTFTFKRSSKDRISVVVSSVKGTNTAFEEWSGDCAGDSGSCWLVMDSGKEVTAKFTRREVIIESYACNFRKRIGDAYEYFVSASGRASGLVGSVMKEGTLSYFEQFTCPSWTGVQQNVWPYKCGRGDGDPEKTAFTVSLTFNGNKGPPFTLSKGKWLVDMVEKGGYLVTGSDNTDIVCN